MATPVPIPAATENNKEVGGGSSKTMGMGHARTDTARVVLQRAAVHHDLHRAVRQRCHALRTVREKHGPASRQRKGQRG